jgi:hypothetical protein
LEGIIEVRDLIFFSLFNLNIPMLSLNPEPIILDSLSDNNCAYNSFAFSLLYASKTGELAQFNEQAVKELCEKIYATETDLQENLPNPEQASGTAFLLAYDVAIKNDYVRFQQKLAQVLREQTSTKILGSEEIKRKMDDPTNHESPCRDLFGDYNGTGFNNRGHVKRELQRLAVLHALQREADVNVKKSLQIINDQLRKGSSLFSGNTALKDQLELQLLENPDLGTALISDLLYADNTYTFNTDAANTLKQKYSQPKNENHIKNALDAITGWWTTLGRTEWFEEKRKSGVEATDADLGVLGDIYGVSLYTHTKGSKSLPKLRTSSKPEPQTPTVTIQPASTGSHYRAQLPNDEKARKIQAIYNSQKIGYAAEKSSGPLSPEDEKAIKEAQGLPPESEITPEQEQKSSIPETKPPTAGPSTTAGGYTAQPTRDAKSFDAIKSEVQSQKFRDKFHDQNIQIQNGKAIIELKIEVPETSTTSGKTSSKLIPNTVIFDYKKTEVTTQDKLTPESAKLMAETMKAAGLAEVKLWGSPEELLLLEAAFKAAGLNIKDRINTSDPATLRSGTASPAPSTPPDTPPSPSSSSSPLTLSS